MTAVPALRPFFKYYGGKWRDAPKHYPPPAHGSIVEPFAGAAGYSVRYPHNLVRLYDVDPCIVGVWDYLIRVSARDLLALPDIAEGETTHDLRIPQEARWLIGFWINSGVASPRVSPSKWMRSGVAPGSFWGERTRLMLARQVEYIRHWRVYQASYANIGDVGTATWFIDPPYEGAGKHYRHGSAGIDYQHLGTWCRDRKGQVIVCENAGAQWLPFETLRDVKTTRAGSRSVEAVWIR